MNDIIFILKASFLVKLKANAIVKIFLVGEVAQTPITDRTIMKTFVKLKDLASTEGIELEKSQGKWCIVKRKLSIFFTQKTLKSYRTLLFAEIIPTMVLQEMKLLV